MNDARQDPTTPSPRNAPPVTDRDRLVEILNRRLPPTRPSLVAGVLADALLAEGVTLPEEKPEKAGPVTSEEAAEAFERHHFATAGSRSDLRHALDAAMPLLARDHGLLTREEVERRAREWAGQRGWGATGSLAYDLVRYLKEGS